MSIYVFIIAIVFEVLIRLIPTKFNLSILDNVKSIALQIHSLVDIVLPNKKLENEQ